MTLQQQYNLITEGKGNKAHFLKNAKFQFPNLFNNYTSYEDSVNVLKSKGLITEGTNGVGGVVTGGREQDWVKIFKQNISEEVKAEEKKTSKEVEDVQAHGFDYKDDKNIDNVYGQAFLHGFYTEMQDPKNEEKTTNEVKAIVAKNLAKNPLHYTEDGMFGIKGVGYTTEAPGLGTPKPITGPHKSSGYGTLRENLGHNEEWSLAPEGRFWILTYSSIGGKKEKVFDSEGEAKAWIKQNLEKGRVTSIDQHILQPKNIALQIQDTIPANYTDEDLAGAIDTYLTQAAVSPEVYDRDIEPNFGQWMSNIKNELNRLQMANNPGIGKVGDTMRTSTDRYAELKKAIREIILQELSEGAADNEVAKAQQDLLKAKEAAAEAELRAAQAAKKEAAAERNA